MNSEKRRVLVVDDDMDVLMLIRRTLRSQFEVMVVPTGYDLSVMIDHFKPDLITLDLSFPDENGREICRWIRRRPDYDRIAVLILSGHSESVVAAAASQVGADSYMTKPFEPHTLQSVANWLIEAKQTASLQSPPGR